MRIIVVTGARPNFIKAAALVGAAEKTGIEVHLVHTGQHYNQEMSRVFFQQLQLPSPYRYLGIGSGTHAKVTARCLERLEDTFMQERPDWVVVVGDVNSTLAGALAAAKLDIPVAHVEAGLRSFDRQMPEEINRVVTDAVSNLLLVSEPSGVTNLQKEGRSSELIHLVGNVMIDTMDRFLPMAKSLNTAQSHDLEPGAYALCTLHRPSNVDQPKYLHELFSQIKWAASMLPVLFPVHPRTQARLKESGIWAHLSDQSRIHLVDPMGYLDFLSAMITSKVVFTDSGGIQEETTVLGVPCLTLRDNTERPITVEQGTNQLVGARGEHIQPALEKILAGPAPKPKRPALWDGQAAERIMKILHKTTNPTRPTMPENACDKTTIQIPQA